MDAAKQLKNDTVPFTPRAVSTNAPPLQITMNPFVAGGSVTRMGRPMQTAFGEIVRQIALKTPGVLVVGETGTGKSLLMDLTARACAEMGLSVRRIERGEQLRSMPDGKIDVLLIDEADTIPESGLRMLLPQGGQPPAATMVFMCPPSSADRFNLPELRIAAIALTPLSHADARTYLQERAASIGRASETMSASPRARIWSSSGCFRARS